MEPIWKDYNVMLYGSPAATSVEFRILVGDAVIYQGRAYRRPGASTITARINDICADYFTRTWGENAGDADPFVTFTIQYRMAGSGWMPVGTVTFRPDWSYEPDYIPESDGCNFPPVASFVPGQLLPITIVGETAATAVVTIRTPNGDYNLDFNGDFFVYGNTPTDVTLEGDEDGHAHWLDLSQWPTATEVSVAGRTWKVADVCGAVVLYYINAYGYWDAMVLEGRTGRRDALTRYNAKHEYNNGQTYARGEQTYAVEVVPTYTLRTGGLTTDQAALMHHLLNSPCVYMQEDGGDVVPIVLTGTDTEYQNQRGTLHFYEFGAVLAQDRQRR